MAAALGALPLLQWDGPRCAQILVGAAAAPPEGGVDPLKATLHELCSAVVESGKINASEVVTLLSDESKIPPELLPRITSDLADVFWFMGLKIDADVKAAAAAGQDAPMPDANSGDAKASAGSDAAAAKPRLISFISALLGAGVLPPGQLKARLDPEMLQDIRLIKDQVDFHKAQFEEVFRRKQEVQSTLSRESPFLLRLEQVRMNTRALYTQQKYNLLREESEGYSKLITELAELPAAPGSTFGAGSIPALGSSANSRDVSTSTRACASAAEVVANVQSLIGYFDLDPNRVLDLVLEALEAVPARVGHTSLVKLFNPRYLPHVLGFKFQFYHNEHTPPSLYNLAALLLRQRSLSLEQLLPHLSPSLEDMATSHAESVAKALEAARRIGVVSLASAAPLEPTDGTSDSRDGGTGESKDTTDEMEGDVDAVSAAKLQPVGLLRALLLSGDWPTAAHLMSLMEGVEAASFPPVAEALASVAEWSLSAAYATISPAATLFPQAAAPTRAPSTSAITGWNSNGAGGGEVPPLLQHADPATALRVALPVLQRLGLYLNSRPLLFAQICRVSLAALQDAAELATGAADPNEGAAVPALVEALAEHCLLPALVVSRANPGRVHELWKVLEKLPYTARYRLYGLLHARLDEASHPEIATARATTADQTKKMMRRLSKENTKQYGRYLGKITHCNPSVVFDTILGQIQAYDNLIVPVVDMMKYLTPMSFDVLTYMLLSHLSSPSKTRLKEDGLNVSLWMQSLSSFCGNLYKKYPGIELVGLLQYITNTLKSGQGLQLLVLRDLVTKMAGIDTLEDLSAEQLQAQAGGETLRSCVTDLLGVAKNTKRSSLRLKDALQKHGLVAPLFLLIAQQRSASVFLTDSPHLKMLGELYDRCQETLEQLRTFVATTFSPAEYASLLPPVGELCTTYRVEPEVAFFISRPALAYLEHKTQRAAETGSEGKATLKAESNADTKSEEHAEGKGDGKAADGEGNGSGNSASLLSALETSQQIRKVLPEASWQAISPQLYTTFWRLSLYDILVPRERYAEEMRRLRRQIEEIDRYVPPIGSMMGAAMDVDPRAAAAKRKKDRERLQSNIERLKVELKAQEERNKSVLAHLKASCGTWFAEQGNRSAEAMNLFLQHCIFPRCVFSPADAVYCAEFVRITHAQGTPYFSTLQYYDKLLRDTSVHIFSCTERQAVNLGRFLNESIKLLIHWKSSEAVYRSECASLPGFSVSFNKVDAKKASYEDYIKVVFKWFCKILKSLVHCLESSEYMEVRNALHVLTRTIDVFPGMRKLCEHLERKVDVLRSEERKDLQIQASQYYTMLQKVKPKLLTQDQFCCGFAMKQGDRPAAADGAAGRAAAGKAAAVAEAPATATTVKDEPSADVTKARPRTPEATEQPDQLSTKPVASSPLNPAAPAFVPSGPASRGAKRERDEDPSPVEAAPANGGAAGGEAKRAKKEEVGGPRGDRRADTGGSGGGGRTASSDRNREDSRGRDQGRDSRDQVRDAGRGDPVRDAGRGDQGRDAGRGDQGRDQGRGGEGGKGGNRGNDRGGRDAREGVSARDAREGVSARDAREGVSARDARGDAGGRSDSGGGRGVAADRDSREAREARDREQREREKALREKLMSGRGRDGGDAGRGEGRQGRSGGGHGDDRRRGGRQQQGEGKRR